MLRHLTTKIKATGPVPVAEDTREVLTNPVTGYYVRNNMLGPDGDFITSPEVSQIFGELLGVWIVSVWMGAGRPKPLQLVELGPGRGSLASDVLRVISQLRSVLGRASVSLHLVEVSPARSRLQDQNLTGSGSQEAHAEDEPVSRRGETAPGLPVSWYRHLEDVLTADPERLEGGDGGHRPREAQPAEVRHGAVPHSGLVHTRTGRLTDN
ncbi:protein arginine methyltransferase NDUFAF7, mitochondrial [Etheostoma spectabile]|uniref:protein arginine methyltransferase NDUFAF7, mitochondrial n=1 Tax=Etheostoma spectabile TaxID=54343 RepID=UPI0013AFDA70|nr:protein arginine methyltransferase NDUFAF7, mitochondrial-like [Etheostoma spectabile]